MLFFCWGWPLVSPEPGSKHDDFYTVWGPDKLGLIGSDGLSREPICDLMREGLETFELELNHLRKNQKSDRVLPFTYLFLLTFMQ